MRIPFLAQSYESATVVQSTQRLVNMLFEEAPPTGVSQATLIPAPGEIAWTSVPLEVGCRGYIKMASVLYVIYGTNLFKVDSAGAATVLGTVEGSARCKLAENGTQVVVVADTKSYVYSTYTSTFAEITDSNFLEASDVAFLDNYFIFTQKGTNQFFISPLLNDITGESDLTAFDATDRARALSSAGKIVGIKADHKELWIFKDDSFTEVWQGVDSPDFPFARFSGAYAERSAYNKHSTQKVDNTLIWFGEDKVFYRANGYIPARISNYGIENKIAQMSYIDDVFTDEWYEGGHKFFGAWFPTAQYTIIYDSATNLWHERESAEYGYWRVNGICKCYGKTLLMDSESSTIGEFDFNTFTEYGTTKPAYMVGPTLHAEGALFSVDRLEVLCETGLGGVSGDEPEVTLFISKNFGRTYPAAGKKRSLGKVGEYEKRPVWRQLGTYKQMTPKLRFTNNVKRYVLDAYAELSPRRV